MLFQARQDASAQESDRRSGAVDGVLAELGA
jgi:hypothetical protein